MEKISAINKDMENVFWTEKPSILIETYDKFIPTKNMSRNEQMNAITLFSLYSLLIIYFIGYTNKITNILFIGIIVLMVFLYYTKYKKIDVDNIEEFEVEAGYVDSDNKLRLGKFYSAQNQNKQLDKYVDIQSKANKEILDIPREPTVDNPFVNPILTDYNTENAPYPINVEDDVIKEQVNLTYNKDLFKDMSDLFDEKNTQRQFYTIPGGSIPNDQQKFAEWCYKTPKTCKEDSRFCVAFDDIRYRTSFRT
jgi:hypothetical protein